MEGLGSTELSIKNLPPELNLENILNLELQDMLNLCSSNANFQMICKKYEELIYNNLLKRDFGFYNEKVGSKIVYKLLYEIASWDSNLNPFNIYIPIQKYDYKGLQHLVDLGFLNKTRYANVTPLEYVIINYNKIPYEKQGDANKIIDLIVKITIQSNNISRIELKTYILSKILSLSQKKGIVDVSKNILNNKTFLQSISSEYYNPELHEIMEYTRDIVRSDLQQYIYPVSNTISDSIKNNDVNAFVRLLKNKNYTKNDLDSSVIIAAVNNKIDLLDLLLQNGGDINYKFKNYSVLEYATDSLSVKPDTLFYLLNNGAIVTDKVFKITIKKGRYNIIRRLLEKVSDNVILPSTAKELFKWFRLKLRFDFAKLLELKGFQNPYSDIDIDDFSEAYVD